MNHIILSKELTPEKRQGLLKKAKDPKYFQDFIDKNLALTKKGIAKSFSDDLLLMNTLHAFDELQQCMQSLGKRLHDAYSHLYPEFCHQHKTVDLLLEAIGKKEQKDAMSPSFAPKDREELIIFAKSIKALQEQKRQTQAFLEKLAQRIIPNTSELLGFELASRLLSLAGSAKKLALMPSSTIQLLGAQKAVFRHVVSGAKSPKHGILFTHPLVKGSHPSRRGKIARLLADKIVVACRVDFFKGEACGSRLLEEVKKNV